LNRFAFGRRAVRLGSAQNRGKFIKNWYEFSDLCSLFRIIVAEKLRGTATGGCDRHHPFCGFRRRGMVPSTLPVDLALGRWGRYISPDFP
jgi:hypothetical protein